MEDGIAALTVLRIARDLPLWRRLLVRRRCRIIFGDQWSDIAEQQVDVSTDPKVDADHLFANALFWDLHHEGDPAIGRNRIGLVQRAYSSNSEDNAARLATHLSRLSKSR